MKVESGQINKQMPFIALDDEDGETPLLGLVSGNFTVYRTRNGGTRTAYTTPTITEKANGGYWLLIDEDTTLDSGADTQEALIEIIHAGMRTVYRSIEIYRPKATLGETVTASSGNVSLATAPPTAAQVADAVWDEILTTGHEIDNSGADILKTAETAIQGVKTATDANLTGNAFTRLGAPAGASISADIAATKAAAEAAEAAASSGINISQADRDAIAARVNATRSTFYPVRARVWNLQRSTTEGVVVVDDVVLSKQPAEEAKCWIDFGGLVGRGEAVDEIESLAITGSTFEITEDSEELVGNLLGFKVTDGAAGATGTVSFDVSTTAGQRLQGEVQISVPE